MTQPMDNPLHRLLEIRRLAWHGRQASGQPGHLGRAPRLVGGDGLLVLHRQRDLVLPPEERLLAERVHLEAVERAIGRRQRLPLEIHADRGARTLLELPPD